MMTPALELLSDGERPRSLGCHSLSLTKIASQTGMTLDGRDGNIAKFATLSNLKECGGIIVTYLRSARFASLLRSGDDVAVVTRPDLRWHLQPGNIALFVNDNPLDLFYTAFVAAVENGSFEKIRPFVSSSAKVHKMAVIEDNVHIESGAMVGAGAVVLANTYVGRDVVIKPNATVGGDGYENAMIGGRHAIVPHVGGVWLSEGVQVGSSTCIDRGLFGDFTFLGANTTIDNLVHFAHSARTGRNCSLVACSEISGGDVLGDGVWLGPNVSVNQGLTIGDHCYVGTGAVVTRDLPRHSLAYGSPAKVAAKVCACRAKLQFGDGGAAVCGVCGRAYRLDSDSQVQNA